MYCYRLYPTLSPPQVKITGGKEHPHSRRGGSCWGRERALLLPHQLNGEHGTEVHCCLLTFRLESVLRPCMKPDLKHVA